MEYGRNDMRNNEQLRGNSKKVNLMETVHMDEGISSEARMGLPQTSIGSGKTVSFLDSDGSMFYVVSGTMVTFSVELATSAFIHMGYISSNEVWNEIYSGTGNSHSMSFKISQTGYYRFYITNSSSNTVQVTGGTISF